MSAANIRFAVRGEAGGCNVPGAKRVAQSSKPAAAGINQE
jgi:hypothetical protein